MENTNNIASIGRAYKKEQRQLQFRKFISSPGLMVGGSIILILALLAILAPLLSAYDPFEMKPTQRLMPPGAANPMGTDEFGRDLLTRVLYGARVSMIVGFSVCLISTFIGLIIGIYASYYRYLDGLLMRISDGLIAIPGVLLAIALMAALGASQWNVVIALTIVFTPSIARVVRSSALVVLEQPYIEAERVQGSSSFRILWINVVPNVLSPLMVQATYIFASAILSEAALSFLGAGIPEPLPSWGNILQASKLVINKAWWMAIFPGLFLILSVLGLNLLGDGLRDFLDPRIKSPGKKLRREKKNG